MAETIPLNDSAARMEVYDLHSRKISRITPG